MFPSKSAIRNHERHAQVTRIRARVARQHLRRAVKDAAVSPPVLLGGVITGFIAGRSLGKRRPGSSSHGGTLRLISRLSSLYSLIRFI